MRESARTRVLIVDDEWLARHELRGMLSGFEEIEIAGEADSVSSAAEAVERLKPDAVFLDIQMPGGSGFELIELIEPGPSIVFVTAYDEFALRAFEVNALDYLLKPVNPARLAESVERIRSGSSSRSPQARPAAGGAAETKGLGLDDNLLVRTGVRMKFLRIGDIRCIRAAGDYTEVHVSGGGRILVSKRMKEWEARLPSAHFCRIHRSTIVMLDRVSSVDDIPGGGAMVRVEGVEEPLTISRRYKSRLRSMMK